MIVKQRPYQLHFFTLRLWQEVLDDEEWEWRGEVKNTSNGEVRYFRDWHALVHLLPVLLAGHFVNEVPEKQSFDQPIYSLQERNMTTIIQTLEAGVHATNRVFEAAFTHGNAADAATVYTTDGQALPPNGTTVAGRDALQNFWQGVMDMGVKNVTLETVELVPCGEGAYEVGKATLYAEGGAIIDTAKFIVLWQQEHGQWKWHRDIWNSNNPA